MAGNIGHKVVVDINLTSIDMKDEEDGEDMAEEEENEDDVPEEMEASSVKGKRRLGKRWSKVELADRPVRKRKPKQQFHCSSLGWTYEEKRKLLEALKKHPPSAIDLIQAEVSSKTKLQMKDYLNKINKSIQWKSDNPMPAVDWINMARDLVRTEKKDYTDSLPRAMSIVSCFEDHPEPADRVPDYSTIYRYLALVLEGKELPLLGPLESAVMLDLLHSVVNKIAMSDTTRQRQVMKWKYQLLSSKVEILNCQQFIKQARNALTNNFSEFEDTIVKQEPGVRNTETGQARTPSSTQQSSGQKSSTGQQSSTVTASTNDIQVSNRLAKSATTVNTRKSLTINETTILSHNTDKPDKPSPTVQPHQVPLKIRHKKSKFELLSIRPETDIIISKNAFVSDDETEVERASSKKLPAKRGITVGIRGRQRRADDDSIQILEEESEGPPIKRHRGSVNKIKLNPRPDSHVVHNDKRNATVSTSDQSQSVSTNESRPSESTENQSRCPPPGKKRKVPGRPRKGTYKMYPDGPDTSQSSEDYYWRGRGRPAGFRKTFPEKPPKFHEDPSEIPKKPSLYTLNPFCVPVSLLPLHKKAMHGFVKVTNQKPLPEIVTKKRGPMFNKQKLEGITSVSVHRMAAVIPVSKQHILLPNSGTQKSQS